MVKKPRSDDKVSIKKQLKILPQRGRKFEYHKDQTFRNFTEDLSGR